MPLEDTIIVLIDREDSSKSRGSLDSLIMAQAPRFKSAPDKECVIWEDFNVEISVRCVCVVLSGSWRETLTSNFPKSPKKHESTRSRGWSGRNQELFSIYCGRQTAEKVIAFTGTGVLSGATQF